MNWTLARLKKAAIASRTAKYEAIPATEHERKVKEVCPDMFVFDALSVGDNDGQAFFVPLDESNREVAELIIRAIIAYEGD